MTARLATALLPTPGLPADVADVIWRQADLAEATWAGTAPSSQLFAELLLTAAAGKGGEHLARLTPDADQHQQLVAHNSAYVRAGAAKNSHVTIEQLTRLAADPAQRTAEVAREQLQLLHDARTNAPGTASAVRTLVEQTHLQSIRELLTQAPDQVAVTVSYVSDQTALFEQLTALDTDTCNRLAVEILTNYVSARIQSGVVRWALDAGDIGLTALQSALADPRRVRQQLSAEARTLLVAQGLLPAAHEQPRTAGPGSSANLETLALALTPTELSAYFFSSNEPVSDRLRDQLLQQAPAPHVAGFLLGASNRRADAATVRTLLLNASAERRAALSDAVAASSAEDGSTTDGLPWAGELALGLRTQALPTLGPLQRRSLYGAIVEQIGTSEAAWEYLLVLSEEWETTLADLIISAAAMDRIGTVV